MKDEEIYDSALKLHEDSWEKIINFCGRDLERPYFYSSSMIEAYSEMHNSLHIKGFAQIDIPVPYALIQPHWSGLFDRSGKPTRLFIYHGGVLLPRECLDNEEEKLSIGITHVNSQNFLRSSALAYGLILPEVIQTENAFLLTALDDFEELTSSVLAYQVLKDDASIEKFSRTLIEYRKKQLRVTSPLRFITMDVEKESEKLAKNIEMFLGVMEKYDPIADSLKLLYEFNRTRGIEELIKYLYNEFVELYGERLIVERRKHDGDWKKVDVFLGYPSDSN